MFLKYLAKIKNVGKTTVNSYFANVKQATVKQVFRLVDPYHVQIFPESFSGFLFEQGSKIQRTELGHF